MNSGHQLQKYQMELNSRLLILPPPRTMNRFAALLFVFKQLFSRSPPIKKRGGSVFKPTGLRAKFLGLPRDLSDGRALCRKAPNIVDDVVGCLWCYVAVRVAGFPNYHLCSHSQFWTLVPTCACFSRYILQQMLV